MQNLFVAFLTNPSPESFLAIRTSVLGHPNFDAYSQHLQEMEDAYSKQRYSTVKEVFGKAQPNLLLSPGAHLLLSMTLKAEEDSDNAEVERFICLRCIEGIRATGDGTREKPYVVLRTSDEYDLLSALGKEFVGQELHHVQDRSFDRLHCMDGTELWFDITDMVSSLARRLKDAR